MNVPGVHVTVEGTDARAAVEQLVALGSPFEAHLCARSGKRGRWRVLALARTRSPWQFGRGREQR